MESFVKTMLILQHHFAVLDLEAADIGNRGGMDTLPGITRTRRGITSKYGRIQILGICLDFCDSQLYLTQ